MTPMSSILDNKFATVFLSFENNFLILLQTVAPSTRNLVKYYDPLTCVNFVF